MRTANTFVRRDEMADSFDVHVSPINAAATIFLKRGAQAAIAVAIMLGLVSCASLSVPGDYSLRGKTDEGLAVVSLSFDGIPDGAAPTWKLQSADRTSTRELLTQTVWEPLDWHSPPGRLAYIALPPGQYEFFQSGFAAPTYGPRADWTIGRGGIATNSNPYAAGFNQPTYTAYMAEPFLVKFDIKGGQLTYIGNLHFTWNEPDQKWKVVVRNQDRRDLKLLREKLPLLTDAVGELLAK